MLERQDGEDIGKEEERSGEADRAVGAVGGQTDLSAAGGDKQNLNRAKYIEELSNGSVENRFGRLVVSEGKSRYVSSSFWANLSTEVEDLKELLNQTSDEEDDDQASTPGLPQLHETSNHHGFIFSASSHNADLLSLHPQPGQIELYWEIFKDRVDPLVKVLHLPTLQPTIRAAASSLSALSRGFECLLFAIYYCTATSLSSTDCIKKLGEERSVLLTRYRFGVEQALARANFLTTEELTVLQAFVLFLICLRRNNDARVIWTLTGLVVRIAQTMGVHRDGSHFGLTPFETEMRRRLWYQICVLDVRASEDHGCDPTILEQSYDTKMPLNINDEDMSPEMPEHPRDKLGCTDMSFCLLRFEMGNYFRRLTYVPPGPTKPGGNNDASMLLAEKESFVEECHRKIKEKYLDQCDMSKPLSWVVATVAKITMNKMWLMLYHPFQRQDRGSALPKETREKLFITSIENLEYSVRLDTEPKTLKWNWMFRTYMQWHALAFTLSELCHRTDHEVAERAWAAVESVRDARWGSELPEDTNSSQLWRPLKKIYRKAREAHQRDLPEAVSAQPRIANQPMRTYSPNPNPMFGHTSRPRVTRAPLSQAQLQRFSETPPPSNTGAPLASGLLSGPHIDSFPPSQLPYSMLQSTTHGALSPSLPARTASMTSNNLANGYFGNIQPQPGSSMAPSMNAAFASTNFYPIPSNPALSGIPNSNPASYAGTQLTEMNYAPAAALADVNADMDLMDTSGDVDWANWEQLVRQYGMDIGSGAVAGAVDSAGTSDSGPELIGTWNGRHGTW
jgi:hypothetical protein